MSNSLGNVAEKWTTLLDEIVCAETKTTDLNMNQNLLGEYSGNGKIKLPKISMDGLGNYSRTTGFTDGGLTLQWEDKTLAYDRGREFTVDLLDDEERVGVLAFNAMTEFVRTKVIPEVDAVRFARLAAAAGTSVSKTFTGDTAVTDAQAAILAAEAAIEDAGASLDGVVIYTTAAFKNLLREGAPYRFGAGEGPNTRFESYDGMKVVTVPQARFYSAITLYDGTTEGQTAGGFIKDATSGKDINFMLVDPRAAAAISRHDTLRYFAPEVNQTAESHLWQYRIYHDLLTFDNKAALIYKSIKA